MSELSKKISEGDNLHRLNHFTIVHPEIKLNKKMMDIASITDRSDQLEEIDTSTMSKEKTQESISFQFSKPSDYLSKIKEYMPKEIISDENYQEIQNVANYFNNDITSFFGFEIDLAAHHSKSDYLFAVSSKNHERDALLSILEKNNFPDELNNNSSWKSVKEFTQKWSEPDSLLNERISGIWLEFDTSESLSDFPIPNFFFQTKKIRIDTEKDEQEFSWLTKEVIPILIRKKLSKRIENNLIESIKKLPKGSSVFHFGTMLSRNNAGIRIVINRIKPEELLNYLHSIGWNHENQILIELLDELSKYISRIILQVNISEKIDEKIGIECSFTIDKYHTETEWEKFLDFLEHNNFCKTEKKEAILNFVGAEFSRFQEGLSIEEYMPSVMLSEHSKPKALVRYLSHIKIVYSPNEPIVVKAYPAVRLLGSEI